MSLGFRVYSLWGGCFRKLQSLFEGLRSKRDNAFGSCLGRLAIEKTICTYIHICKPRDFRG